MPTTQFSAKFFEWERVSSNIEILSSVTATDSPKMQLYKALLFLIVVSLLKIVDIGYCNQIVSRFEYKYSFKPPYLAQKDGSVPFWEYGGSMSMLPITLYLILILLYHYCFHCLYNIYIGTHVGHWII